MSSYQYAAPSLAPAPSAYPSTAPMGEDVYEGLPSAGIGNRSDTPWLDAAEGEVRAQGRPLDGAPATKEAALRNHMYACSFVIKQISALAETEVPADAGAGSPALLERNAGEWVENGGPGKVVVLTQVHDAHLRPAIPKGQRGYFDFDAGVWDGPSAADYDDTLTDREALNSEGVGVMVNAGKAVDGALYLRDPQNEQADEIRATILHEVQHLSDSRDHIGGADAPKSSTDTTAARWVYSLYESEFRSFWNEAHPVSHGPEPRTIEVWTPSGRQSATTGFESGRQQEVFFRYLHAERKDGVYRDADGNFTQTYAEFTYFYVVDPAFRAAVNAMSEPVGGNLVLSVRIEALQRAIELGHDYTNELEVLDPFDRAFLADPVHSEPFWRTVHKHLTRDELAELEEALR